MTASVVLACLVAAKADSYMLLPEMGSFFGAASLYRHLLHYPVCLQESAQPDFCVQPIAFKKLASLILLLR